MQFEVEEGSHSRAIWKFRPAMTHLVLSVSHPSRSQTITSYLTPPGEDKIRVQTFPGSAFAFSSPKSVHNLRPEYTMISNDRWFPAHASQPTVMSGLSYSLPQRSRA